MIKKAGELGFLGVIFPEEYGGAGLGYVDYVIVDRRSCRRVDASVGIIVAAHNSLGTNHIFKFGSEEQRRRYIPKLASRRVDRRLGADRARGRLGRRGHAHHGRAGRRRLGPERLEELHHQRARRRHLRGLGRDRPRRPRSTASPPSSWRRARRDSGRARRRTSSGMRASDTGEVVMEDCRVSEDQLLGKRGRGLRRRHEDSGRRPHLDRRAGARHRAAAPTRRRCATPSSGEQFGQPIAEFQAIQFIWPTWRRRSTPRGCSDHRAAAEHGRGRRGDAPRPGQALRLARSPCAPERGVQIHGGYGFIKDYPAEKFYRDVKLCTIGEGTSEIQRLVIARQLAESR